MSKYLSRGIDYLGDLGAKLRDLQGYRTLAYELIQNADDARNATSMVFDVRDDGLIVDNDGQFSDCGEIDESECPWKQDPTLGHRCDFHRFRHIASGDKRAEQGTTGAFGIGFIAVYQVTDRPELISAGRHWILREDLPEHERIEVCEGCAQCRASDLPGTRFVLPWARDPDSVLRRALRAEVVPANGVQSLLDELGRSVPIAMLFLKRLRTIEIRRSHRLAHTYQRVDQDDTVILADGDASNDQIWHVVKAEFDEIAARLRRQHPTRIEDKRSSDVTLAIPGGPFGGGLLCACLPTEHDVGLPFHVNADFFPTNDRKRVILGNDFQAEWNRAALAGAAAGFGAAIEHLKTALGPERFWELISVVKEVADEVGKGRGDVALTEFWNAVGPQLPRGSLIYTSAGKWCGGEHVLLLQQREEAAAIPVLEAVGINIVHENLRPYQSLLHSDAVGARLLGIEHLCEALKAQGLDRRVELDALPTGLATSAAREALWREITLLLERQRHANVKADDERRLRTTAIAPGRDDALWPCGDLYAADDQSVELFESVGVGICFVSRDSAFAPLRGLCRQFDAAAAIDALHAADESALADAWRQGRFSLETLFDWFENRREQILSDDETKRRLAALALYPGSDGLQPLRQLGLPGDFQDPLGLAELVDLEALADRHDFLRDLGMRQLDFTNYAVNLLPAALRRSSVAAEKRRAAAVLLAGRVGELRDNGDAREALASAQLVECTDGVFREARECYFEAVSVQTCLEDAAHVAVLPAQHVAAVRELYRWLGVSAEPRLDDILRLIRELAEGPYSAPVAARVQSMLAHLGQRLVNGEDVDDLAPLRGLRWLPARGRVDRWYAPSELYAAYQATLFESQAPILDASLPVQRSARDLLQFLGIQLTPPVSLVVKHLQHCAAQGVPAKGEIYGFLNDKADDPAVLRLVGTKCLWLGDAYRAPHEVFWTEHQFGRYRRRLGEELRTFSSLLTKLQVRDSPNHDDALSVLKEIATAFGTGNLPLDAESITVLMACWHMLDRALADGAITDDDIARLATVKCVARADGVLQPPEWMFFENRAGLAAKFGTFLKPNVIARPLGAGAALVAAGVRLLGSAVKTELLECTDPVDDASLPKNIWERRNQIARVLESQIPGKAAAALPALAGLTCASASAINIRYRLSAFNRERHSEPEAVPALYQPEQRTLFFTRSDRMPWPAIAREVAIALFPEEDPGRFAAGLKEVLVAESVEDAAVLLDDLGLAPLDTTALDASPVAEPITTLGTAMASDEVPFGGGVPALPGADPLTTEEAVSRLLGPDAPSPTAPALDPAAESLIGGVRGRSGVRVSTPRQGRPVLRSYIPAPADPTASADPNNDEARQERSPVDEAGVRHVLDYELQAGRTPKEMPHKNPGYDVESRDQSGAVIRFIEVKSFSGRWGNTYADLSRRQFEKATELGDVFWLYVVERAESDDFRIHPIPNPVVKANHFMFDDGWRALAEPTPSPQGD